MRTVDETCHLVADLGHQGEAVGFGLDVLELHVFDVLYDYLVDLQELLHNARVLQLQHDLHEFPQLQHVLRVVDAVVEELFEGLVLARLLDHLDHVDLALFALPREEEAAVELDVLLFALAVLLAGLLLLLLFLAALLLVVDVLRLEGDEGGSVLRPVFLDVLDLPALLLLLGGGLGGLAIHPSNNYKPFKPPSN